MNGYEIDDDLETRARRIAERASHGSVNEELLCGKGRFTNNFYLHEKPLVAHLDDSEQPHFGFYNERKGIGVGGKRDTNSPDPSGITAILLTDRRVLAVLGKENGDERLTIPYEVVTGAEYHTGIMKHRIAVETVDTTYHLWINSGYDESTLREATELVAQRMSGGEAIAAAGSSPAAASSDGGAKSDDRDDGTTGASAAGPGTASGDGAGDDPLDRLERLQELREKGAVTEEEFQRKKSELLDEI